MFPFTDLSKRQMRHREVQSSTKVTQLLRQSRAPGPVGSTKLRGHPPLLSLCLSLPSSCLPAFHPCVHRSAPAQAWTRLTVRPWRSEGRAEPRNGFLAGFARQPPGQAEAGLRTTEPGEPRPWAQGQGGCSAEAASAGLGTHGKGVHF